MTPVENPILAPTGELTIFEAASFRDSLVTLLGNDGSVELDLSSIQLMDGAGIQLVLAAKRYERCSLTKVEGKLQEMMELMGYASEKDIDADESM